MMAVEFECPCDRHIEINLNNIPDWHVPSDIYNDKNVYFVPPTMEQPFQAKVDEILGE